MADVRAELSSLASALNDITRRLGGLAESSSSTGQRSGDDTLAVELFEVERSLNAAQRRLERLVDDRR